MKIKNSRLLKKEIARFKRELQHSVNDETVLCRIAQCYIDLGDFRTALLYLKRALRVNPQDKAILDTLGIAYTDMAMLAWRKGQKKKARGYAKSAIKVYKKIKDALYLQFERFYLKDIL